MNQYDVRFIIPGVDAQSATIDADWYEYDEFGYHFYAGTKPNTRGSSFQHQEGELVASYIHCISVEMTGQKK